MEKLKCTLNQYSFQNHDKLTTSLSRLSGTLRVELHNANAEEWEYITGASLTAKVSLAV